MALDDKVSFLSEKSELLEVFDNLDADRVSKETNLSPIDMNSNLNRIEIKNLMIFDQFKSIGLLPKWANIGASLKRLSCSEGALGRKQKVEIASAKREAQHGTGITGAIGRLFTPKV